MELKDDEFQTLRLKVDQISSELEKQRTMRAVNTKWMAIVGSLILAAFGFTSFIQVPREVAKSVKEKIGQEVIYEAKATFESLEREAKKTFEELKEDKNQADKILSGMKNFDQHIAGKEGYAWVGGIKFVWGKRKSTSSAKEKFSFKPEFSFKKDCFAVITSLSGRMEITKTGFTLDRHNDYKREKLPISFVAIGN
jgi:hypothetical protein